MKRDDKATSGSTSGKILGGKKSDKSMQSTHKNCNILPLYTDIVTFILILSTFCHYLGENWGKENIWGGMVPPLEAAKSAKVSFVNTLHTRLRETEVEK